MRSVAAIAALACLAMPAAAAPREVVLYDFTGGNGGAYPVSPLLAVGTSTLYGTTAQGGTGGFGTVYRLTAPAPGQTGWQQTVLYSFQDLPDGRTPIGGLVMDRAGALYGTASSGGSGTYGGIVFKLTPPAMAGAAWTETVLYRFVFGTGSDPNSTLLMRRDGALFGTTVSGGTGNDGTIFNLMPPQPGQTSWTHHTLFSFTAIAQGVEPNGIVADEAGNLYGTTSLGGAGNEDAGVVFRLSPPDGGGNLWSETVLYSFANSPDGAEPRCNLIMDSSGALYGTTNDGGGIDGTVFKLSPPPSGRTDWTETQLYVFKSEGSGHPAAGLTMDGLGNLYGDTEDLSGSHGTVFRLSPPSGGSGQWIRTGFAFDGADGSEPAAPLVHLRGRLLVGTTTQGGSHDAGTVFAISDP